MVLFFVSCHLPELLKPVTVHHLHRTEFEKIVLSSLQSYFIHNILDWFNHPGFSIPTWKPAFCAWLMLLIFLVKVSFPSPPILLLGTGRSPRIGWLLPFFSRWNHWACQLHLHHLINQLPFHSVTRILHRVCPFASSWLPHFYFQGFAFILHLWVTCHLTRSHTPSQSFPLPFPG